MNVGGALTEKARRIGQKRALAFQGQEFTYAEMNGRVNRLANALSSRGFKKGDHIAVLLFNCPQFLEAYFALAKLGIVMIPLNFRLHGKELEYIINDSEAKALLFGEAFRETIGSIQPGLPRIRDFILIGRETPAKIIAYEELIAQSSPAEPDTPEIHLEDHQLIFYTSGTTGRPKGAIHTHESTLWNSADQIISLGLQSSDIHLTVAPLFHVGGLNDLNICMFHMGGTVVLRERFDARETLETIQKEKITTLFAVPSMVHMILEMPDIDSYDTGSLRIVFTGGAPFPVVTIRKFFKHFRANFIQAYGLTEGISVSTFLEPEKAIEKIGSIGKPFYGVELRVVNEQGKDVAPGEIGEIIQKGTHVMKGYWNLPEATRETLRDGWLHTGDLARVDEDGYIYIVDRKKDMIISGGENIYPAEIEQVLYSYPKILEAAVIGTPDEKWGETVKAVVVLKPALQASEQEIIDFCKSHMASYKKPTSVEFVSALPRNPSGKVLKTELRRQFGKAP